jgi:hypothetical protein
VNLDWFVHGLYRPNCPILAKSIRVLPLFEPVIRDQYRCNGDDLAGVF